MSNNDEVRPAWAEIDLGAIKQNVASLKRLLKPKTKLMAVVKANAYGHGDAYVSKAALEAGVNRLGVALVEEGLSLRRAGITAPIQILSDFPPTSAQTVIENDLIATVSLAETAEALSTAAAKLNKTVKIHLKVDTGMNRLGVKPSDAKAFIYQVAGLPQVELEGVFTHFATAGDDGAFFNTQLTRFEGLIAELEASGIYIPIKHAANSAATILEPRSHFDMVRCGISFYGLHPSDLTKQAISLKPALSLKTKISSLRTVEAGEGVSYSHTFKAEKRTNIATLPLGYADGYSRNLSNRAFVLIGGERFRVVGNVCMDQFMVDIGDNQFKLGDEVILIGTSGKGEIGAGEIATLLGTINYEVVCMISNRVPRIYVGA